MFLQAGMSGAPLPCAALTIAVVISGTGDKHYFPSNSLIMSVLPHGWLSKAIPQPLTPAEGLCVQGEIYRVDVCLCLPMCVCLSVCVCACPERPEDELHACFVREYSPLSQLLSTHSPCFLPLFFKASFIDFTAAFKKTELFEAMTGCRHHIF